MSDEVGAQEAARELLRRRRARASLAGFALVVWDGDGTSSTAMRNARTSPMNSTQLPTFVVDRLRRAISEGDAEGVVRDIFNLPEPSP